MQGIRTVCAKELLDTLRDWRSLLLVILVTVLSGPLLLIMITNSLASFEARAERRIVLVQGIDHAPSLADYLTRETVTLEEAPADFRAQLASGKLADPVLLVPPGFEVAWQQDQPLTLELVSHSGNGRANAGVSRLKRWLRGYASERAQLKLLLRGVHAGSYDTLKIEEIDLASARADVSRVFGMLPFFLILAALYGLWSAAIDATAGERERGTLAPVRVTPVSTLQLVLGKWFAIVLVGALVSGLAVFSFLPAQAMMHSETLRAMLAFGQREAWRCYAAVVPLVLLYGAVLMWIGMVSRSVRQAQLGATGVVLLSSVLPLMVQFDAAGQAGWHAWLPVVSQNQMILAVLAGTPVSLMQGLQASAACIALSALMLYCTARRMQHTLD
ncbi:ABC transporter permease [Pseudomethylobacillus aquaticus]|uniref:ABC transporter permease n=1 Tax=Pseudomethylobacillus aquaticus TaxID=2676064 RepID=A0A3N0UXQ8_9PROT|nr:ABC transporter permease subunit [Pseudomethylobacillus aquaticus]ROH85326.1 ABC transporter permease [Pseudomethylobacillus aquaticus]